MSTDSRHQQIHERLNDAAAEHGCNSINDLACWERYRVPSQWCLFCLMQEAAKLCASQEAEIARLREQVDDAIRIAQEQLGLLERWQAVAETQEIKVGELEAEKSAVRQRMMDVRRYRVNQIDDLLEDCPKGQVAGALVQLTQVLAALASSATKD